MAHKPDEQNTPVRAKAVLIDPGSMTIMWMNESASHDLADEGSDAPAAASIAQMAPAAGLPDALRAVADTGVTQHLRADLVSTYQGSMAVVASIYRVPDGKLLVLVENTWKPGHRKANAGDARHSRRRAR